MCEKCLYKKNCQFLAKHRPSLDMVGCTFFSKDIDVLTKETKTEVAREIFEEIEQWLGIDGDIRLITDKKLAELKKKYTEGINE